MKRGISWAIVILIVSVLSSILFITGKQHKIYLTNGKKGMENIPNVIYYSIDSQSFKKIKATKKGVAYVKGLDHIIFVKYKNKSGEDIEISKKFRAKLFALESIDIISMIKNKDIWIKYNKK